jgi:hypothetical protein
VGFFVSYFLFLLFTLKGEKQILSEDLVTAFIFYGLWPITIFFCFLNFLYRPIVIFKIKGKENASATEEDK